MSKLDNIYYLIEANLNDEDERMARISNDVVREVIRGAIGQANAGSVRPVDLMDDEDVLALVRTTRLVIGQIGVMTRVEKTISGAAGSVGGLRDMLNLLVQWLTASIIAKGYLPYDDPESGAVGRWIVEAEISGEPIMEALNATMEGDYHA